MSLRYPRSLVGALVARVGGLSDRAGALLTLCVALVLAAPGTVLRANPNSDGLYYEAQAAELQGASHAVAFHQTFQGPQGREAAAIEDHPDQPRILDPRWDQYSAKFYQRRWLVPALAIGVGAVANESIPRALQTVSMLGYALLAPALFLLLRRRFAVWPSVLGALGCLLLPPMYRWSFGQFVDSWGVLLQTVGLLALVLVADRGLRWLWLWVAAMALLSITRDATMILGLAALILLIAQWRSREARRTNLWLVGTGALSALPALAIGGAPVRENLAYILAGFKIPPAAKDTWSAVLSGYPGQLWLTIRENLKFPLKAHFAAPAVYLGLAFVVFAVLLVVFKRARGDAFWTVVRGSIPGCVLLLLIANNPQGFRLELVFVPVVAAGLAITAVWAIDAARNRWPAVTSGLGEAGAGLAAAPRGAVAGPPPPG